MITLGIETSCDETALCFLETRENEGLFEYRILGNIVHSQIELHKEYGGVFPILAKREHIKNLPILFEKIKRDSGISDEKINVIAVTQGPGLEPALWTGIDFAKELSLRLSIPLIPINHMEGHIVSTLLETSVVHKDFKKLKPFDFPALALLVSGGHTEIVRIEKLGSYKILGQTKDDAIGEAFDKVARMLGLPYPGGPEIGKLAKEAREKILSQTIVLPRPMIHSKDLDMSFSGLKTAVLYTLQKIENVTENVKREIAREFEDSVTEVLVKKIKEALEENEYKVLIIGGGVIANTHIRQAFEKLAGEYSIPLYLPAPGLTGDNALMIALAGALDTKNAENANNAKKNSPSISAKGNLSLENIS